MIKTFDNRFYLQKDYYIIILYRSLDHNDLNDLLENEIWCYPRDNKI